MLERVANQAYLQDSKVSDTCAPIIWLLTVMKDPSEGPLEVHQKVRRSEGKVK